MNNSVHSVTRRAPSEHYDALVGARDTRGLHAEGGQAPRLIALLPRETRILAPFGVEWKGLPYWTPTLRLVPHGTEIHVHWDPGDWRTIHLSVPDPQGALRSLGWAEYYGHDRAAPGFDLDRGLEAEWEADNTARAARLAQTAAAASDRAEGAGLAAELAQAVVLHAEQPPLTALPRAGQGPPPALIPGSAVSRPRRRGADRVCIDPFAPQG